MIIFLFQSQAQELILGYNPAAKMRLISFDTMQSRVVIDLLTGHNTLRRYLNITRLTNSLVCRGCWAEEET
jgi:hypothetical protein